MQTFKERRKLAGQSPGNDDEHELNIVLEGC